MKQYVYVLSDKETKEVKAIYTDKHIADKLKPVIEEKLGLELDLVKHAVNQDIKVIG